ncbi:hypothetical protein [Ramlibacter sp.]|uniref:hypothetical protein n=1 Tax=Ramlibacter sp. TaxID=1917967 RepID=UPI003D0DE6AC
MRSSRLRIDPQSNFPSINTFGELSQFLRAANADDDSRRVSESLSQLASHVEAIVAALRLNRIRAQVAPLLVDLLTVLRAHRQMIVALELPWRGLYEYAGYLQALNNFRVLIGQWLLEGGSASTELALTAEDFELVAWRTLGEGMLMIDMYEQWIGQESNAPGAADPPPTSALGALEEPQVRRAIQWWKRLRL